MRKRTGKGRPVQAAVQGVLRGLGAGEPGAEWFADAKALLDALDEAADRVPANEEVWQQLLAHVGSNGADGNALLRASA